ncbi:MAG: hypothetical protein CMA64_11285 [Euryarchaeota archaeon]|nr:hypothetical protein [Euryarchaeota archaeon]
MAGKNRSSIKNFNSQAGLNVKGGQSTSIQLAEVMDNVDYARLGRLRVFIQGSQADKTNANNWRTVIWTSPFAGATNPSSLIKSDDAENENMYAATQTSYGMWMIPPDVGNIVVVAFVNGRENNGVCLGCVFQPSINHMIPGIAKGKTTTTNAPTVPVAEVNRAGAEAQNMNIFEKLDKTKMPDHLSKGTSDNVRRPAHTPFYDRLLVQGLENDNIRGLTDASARRESPSNVFGILTPGGHQFIMDDKSGGSHMRFRTAGGAQVLMDDNTSTVYVTNTNGTAWVELTGDGKIELWGADSISMRSEKDFNVRADRDINIESGRHINIKTHSTKSSDPETQPKSTVDLEDISGNVFFDVAGRFKVASTEGNDLSTTQTTNIYSGVNHNLTAVGVSNINAGGGHFETASAIHMNGPVAGTALPVTAMELQKDVDGNLLYTNVLETRTATTPIYSPRTTETLRGSILSRYPTREPYPDHEAQSIENATVVDNSITEAKIKEAEATYKETKTATENEMKSVTEKVDKQSNATETYTSLVDEAVGTVTETMKKVTTEIKDLIKKNSNLVPDLNLQDTNKKKAFDDLIFTNESLQTNVVLPNLKAKDLLSKHSPQSIVTTAKKTIKKVNSDFVNFKDGTTV